jgi:hypothetical protein
LCEADFVVVVACAPVHCIYMSLSEILADVRNLSGADKLRLIRILAEDVDAESDVAPLKHGATYSIATPTFEPGAAELLLRELGNPGQS